MMYSERGTRWLSNNPPSRLTTPLHSHEPVSGEQLPLPLLLGVVGEDRPVVLGQGLAPLHPPDAAHHHARPHEISAVDARRYFSTLFLR